MCKFAGKKRESLHKFELSVAEDFIKEKARGINPLKRVISLITALDNINRIKVY